VNAPVKSLLQVEWRPLASLAPIMDDWRSLVTRALEPNVFYEPAFAFAAAPTLGPDVHVGLVWSGTIARRLVGLFPARIAPRRYGLPFGVLVGWTHPFGPLGTPLVDRDLGADVIAAWLDHVGRDPAMPAVSLLPLAPSTGPFATAFDLALVRARRRQTQFDPHRRALLAPTEREGYLERGTDPKRRKELRRQRRRFEENDVTLVVATEPDAVADALATFFTLEASGWKGRAGTAAANDDAVRRFMAQAVIGLAREGKASVHRLIFEGRPAAAAITLRSGDTAWFWKIAYEEALARFSPGVMLAADVTEALLANPAVTRADSCAAPDHPMIDRLWRERLPLSDRLFMVRPEAGLSFALATRLEAMRRLAIGQAKRLRKQLRGS
jgi:CelD/BcsL family acetyltransferase involved in cellulose biosynthesis